MAPSGGEESSKDSAEGGFTDTKCHQMSSLDCGHRPCPTPKSMETWLMICPPLVTRLLSPPRPPVRGPEAKIGRESRFSRLHCPTAALAPNPARTAPHGARCPARDTCRAVVAAQAARKADRLACSCRVPTDPCWAVAVRRVSQIIDTVRAAARAAHAYHLRSLRRDRPRCQGTCTATTATPDTAYRWLRGPARQCRCVRHPVCRVADTRRIRWQAARARQMPLRCRCVVEP